MNQPKVDSPAVHAQLQIYQGIINRMATASASCKTWSITIVSAILVVMADKEKGSYMAVALVPVLLFFFLDAYYLHLERCFIGSYNKILGHVHDQTATDKELFKIAPPKGLGTMCKGVGASISSFSVWPFYTTLAILSVVAGVYLIAPKSSTIPSNRDVPTGTLHPADSTTLPTTRG